VSGLLFESRPGRVEEELWSEVRAGGGATCNGAMVAFVGGPQVRGDERAVLVDCLGNIRIAS
jgi:hypothetical protein